MKMLVKIPVAFAALMISTSVFAGTEMTDTTNVSANSGNQVKTHSDTARFIFGRREVIISDNGPGFNISPEVAVKPFITGKPNNMGMGIGLHLANELMNEMKGKLVFYEKDDLELPDEVVQVGATKAIIALCFPVK